MTPDPHSLDPEASAQDPRHWLSALADGDAQALDRACAQWRDDGDARQTWHTYHLIGDVMRSDELAAAPARDAAFLAALRTRLAAEPVVLAPAPVAAVPSSRRSVWLLPAAVAAGLALVAGVMVVAHVGQPGQGGEAATLAAASSPRLAAAQGQASPIVVGNIIRDARLDEYMRVHQATGGYVPIPAPGGTLRRVDVEITPSPAR
jgi:sigma-E factor negative regulatory protein RseA